jgi:hypothetical protein
VTGELARSEIGGGASEKHPTLGSQKGRRRARRLAAAVAAASLLRGATAYANHGSNWYFGAGADGDGWYAYIYADNNVTYTNETIQRWSGNPSGSGNLEVSYNNTCHSYYSSNVCAMPYTRSSSLSVPSGKWWRTLTCAASGDGSGGIHKSPTNYNFGPCASASISGEGYGQPGGAISFGSGNMGTNITEAEVK